jgi:hypothetical protein
LNNVYCATPLCNCPLQFGNQNVRLSSCQSFVGKKFPAAGLQSLSFAGPAGSPPPVLSLISKQVHPVASRSIFIGFVAFVQLRLLLYRKAYIGSTASSSTPPRIWRRLEHASDPAACPCFSAAATRQRPQDSAQQVRDGMPLIQRSGYAAVSPGFGSAGTRRCAPASATYARRRRSHARLQYRRTSVFALHKGQLHAHLVQQKLKKNMNHFIRISLLIMGQKKRSVTWRLLSMWMAGMRGTTAAAAGTGDYCVQNAACMALAVRRKSRRGGGYLITTRRQRDF